MQHKVQSLLVSVRHNPDVTQCAHKAALMSISGTVGATTLSVAQLAAHGHTFLAARAVGGNQDGGDGRYPIERNLTTDATGGSSSHGHGLAASIDNASSLPPYYTLTYIIRVA